ncbi:hypothetical protein ABTA98_19495, partial [Acinetobacter baumannii]
MDNRLGDSVPVSAGTLPAAGFDLVADASLNVLWSGDLVLDVLVSPVLASAVLVSGVLASAVLAVPKDLPLPIFSC